MTRWPFCLAEIGLYSVLAGLVIGMVLDARARWHQLRERADTAASTDTEHDQGEGAEVSAVRRKRDRAPTEDEGPPPAA